MLAQAGRGNGEVCAARCALLGSCSVPGSAFGVRPGPNRTANPNREPNRNRERRTEHEPRMENGAGRTSPAPRYLASTLRVSALHRIGGRITEGTTPATRVLCAVNIRGEAKKSIGTFSASV